MEHIIDCKGLKCPQPVINTKKYFDSIKEGTATVIVDNDVAKNNLLKFAKGSGFDSAAKQKDNLYYITITKNSDSCESVDFKSKKLTIVISSNKLGVGNDELGTTLMKSYLYALTESSNLPADLIFLNGGVKLTTEGSDSLDNLKALEKREYTFTAVEPASTSMA